MIKKLAVLLITAIAIAGCAEVKKSPIKATTITKDLKFCEGSLPYGSSLLVSNFGTEELNPLNNENKGYIMKIDGDNTEVFIPADGNLSGPKGMAIAENFLYIADVGKIVVYNLEDKSETPQIITMPEGNLFVNDIVISGNSAYVSVTNTDKIYKLDISAPDSLAIANLTEFATVTGPNGLVLDNQTMYIASYPADGNTTANNVIYKIEDITNPQVEKFITREGQYDGLSLYDSKLYFTSWVNSEIGYVDLGTKETELLTIEGATLTGPADITILNDTLYIPNLPSSEVVIVPLL